MHFMVYGTRPSKDKSGAYLFLPDGKAKVRTHFVFCPKPHTASIATIDADRAPSCCFQPYLYQEPPVVRVVEGPLFSEVVAYYQHFQQAIRIHNVPGNKTVLGPIQIANAADVFCSFYETTRANLFRLTDNLYPIKICFCSLSSHFLVFAGVDGLSVDITTTVDIRDQNNKELALRLVTDIQSGDVFYTDLNGFQVSVTMLCRVLLMHNLLQSQKVEKLAITSFCRCSFVSATRNFLCKLTSSQCPARLTFKTATTG